MLFCLIGSNLERSLMVELCGKPAIIDGSVSLGGRIQCRIVGSWSGAAVPPSDPVSSCHAGTRLPEDWAMLPTNDLLRHHRMRTRSRFDSNFQNAFSIAYNGHLPLNSSDIIVAEHDVAQLVIFLGTATPRGPPWSADQSRYFFYGARDRPTLHFCTTLPLSEFQFQDSSPVCNATQPFIFGEGSWRLACCSHFPIKYNPTAHLKELS